MLRLFDIKINFSLAFQIPLMLYYNELTTKKMFKINAKNTKIQPNNGEMRLQISPLIRYE